MSRRRWDRGKTQATGRGVELPAQYERIITVGNSLEADRACQEIFKISHCDDKKALMEYNCLSIKSKLEQTLQRIRRKLVYIVSYRRHQLMNRLVNLDADFNKYKTLHPDRPMYSAKSMLKLTRWCRFFQREYKPIMAVSVTIPSNMSDAASYSGMHTRQDTVQTSTSGQRNQTIRLADTADTYSLPPSSFGSFNTSSSRHQLKLNNNEGIFKKPTLPRVREKMPITFTRNRLEKDRSNYYQRTLLRNIPTTGDNVPDNLNHKSIVFDIIESSENPLYYLDLIHKEFAKGPARNEMLRRIQHRVSQPFHEEKHLENIFTENCTVCQNKEYVENDFGLPLCQTCFFRRNLFLHGSELRCYKCNIMLTDLNFQAFVGVSWCKRCAEVISREFAGTDHMIYQQHDDPTINEHTDELETL